MNWNRNNKKRKS